VFNELVDFPLPVVAAINGPAVGLGCTMAVLCDLVYIAESAYLADPHVGVGLTAGDGGAPFWPLTMSIVKAKELLFFGTRIGAGEAVELGLANGVVGDGEVLQHATAIAESWLRYPVRCCSRPNVRSICISVVRPPPSSTMPWLLSTSRLIRPSTRRSWSAFSVHELRRLTWVGVEGRPEAI
jgi:enoyl-CoA hydratase/carnithine racemase